MRISLRLFTAACVLAAAVGCQPAEDADTSTDLDLGVDTGEVSDMDDSNLTANGEIPEIESPTTVEEATEAVEEAAADASEAAASAADAAAEKAEEVKEAAEEKAEEVSEASADAADAAAEKAEEIKEATEDAVEDAVDSVKAPE